MPQDIVDYVASKGIPQVQYLAFFYTQFGCINCSCVFFRHIRILLKIIQMHILKNYSNGLHIHKLGEHLTQSYSFRLAYFTSGKYVEVRM